jgi:hypothetical protein
MTMVAYLTVFPTLPVLRRKFPDLARPFARAVTELHSRQDLEAQNLPVVQLGNERPR